MSDARKKRRVLQLQLRREAKKRKLVIGSRAHLTWLMMLANGMDMDDAVSLLGVWDAEAAEAEAEAADA